MIINQIGEIINLSGIRDTTFNFYASIADLNGLEYDLTDFTGKMEIRGSYRSGIVAEFPVILGGNLISIINPASEMTFRAGNYVWDLKMTYPSGAVFRWLRGQFEMLDRSTT